MNALKGCGRPQDENLQACYSCEQRAYRSEGCPDCGHVCRINAFGRCVRLAAGLVTREQVLADREYARSIRTPRRSVQPVTEFEQRLAMIDGDLTEGEA